YCNGSPYLALIEAGYAYSLDEVKEHGKTGKFKTDKIYPWEITKTPGVYDNKEIRIAATKWLVLKSGKQPREVTGYDFDNGSLICRPEYNGSHYLALLEAGLVTQKDEAYMRSHANKT
ncbi:MAG: hypothetical protein Q7S22_06090, partial [Candidatus Micrarchaeota archaeon]|nr:hypothetical protein [Candidatus Micrarchaeota archaeon]